MRKRWTKEEDEQLLSYILKFIEEGNSIRVAVQKASEELDRGFESCYARWNNCLRIEYAEQLESAKSSAKESGNVFYEKWNEEDDNKLIDMVLEETSKGLTTRKAVDKASKEMNRTFVSCYNRWQSVLSKKFENKIVYKGYSDSDLDLNDESKEELKERIDLLENQVREVKEQNQQIIDLVAMLTKNK